MEVIEYEEPESWDDKGMNWNDPDPRNADYVMAIRRALMERYAVIHSSMPSGVLRISPWKTVSISQIGDIVSAIRWLCSSFVNEGYSEYKEDYSDFPKMWTYRDLIQEEGCGLYEFPKTGDFCEHGGEILKRIKNALDKLTVIRCPGGSGVQHSRSGSRHDPPFGESIGDAMDMAMDPERGYQKNTFTRLPATIYAWSGNTHWKCPRPKEEGDSGGDEDDENNKDGYCGYAEAVGYNFKRITNWLLGASLDLVVYVNITAPQGPVPYSQELTTSTFDAGESNFKRGFSKSTFSVKDAMDVDINVGNIDSIPKNSTVPSSDFDDEGNATHRRSAKRGYEGKLWFLSDYGVEGGFKFRSKEA